MESDAYHWILSESETCLVCIFGVDIVLDGIAALLVEVFGGDLDQVRNFCLESKSDYHSLRICIGDFSFTRMNIVILTSRQFFSLHPRRGVSVSPL